MRRLALGAVAVAMWTTAAPATISAQEAQAQRAELRADLKQQRQQRMTELRQQIAERRAQRLRQLAERRPELKQQIEERLAQGTQVRPDARKLKLQRAVKALRPEMFDRLDVNKDGVLSRDEFKARVRRKL